MLTIGLSYSPSTNARDMLHADRDDTPCKAARINGRRWMAVPFSHNFDPFPLLHSHAAVEPHGSIRCADAASIGRSIICMCPQSPFGQQVRLCNSFTHRHVVCQLCPSLLREAHTTPWTIMASRHCGKANSHCLADSSVLRAHIEASVDCECHGEHTALCEGTGKNSATYATVYSIAAVLFPNCGPRSTVKRTSHICAPGPLAHHKVGGAVRASKCTRSHLLPAKAGYFALPTESLRRNGQQQFVASMHPHLNVQKSNKQDLHDRHKSNHYHPHEDRSRSYADGAWTRGSTTLQNVTKVKLRRT